jgi:hypothetical protein
LNFDPGRLASVCGTIPSATRPEFIKLDPNVLKEIHSRNSW